MNAGAVILAGGSGTRMRGSVADKVLCEIFGKPAMEHCARAFLESGGISRICFVCKNEEQRTAIEEIVSPLTQAYDAQIFFAEGGAERQDSVLNGLRALPDDTQMVLIHDGARPLVGAQNVKRVCESVEKNGAAVLASKVSDTIKRVPEGAKAEEKSMLEDLERARLWSMQTPQGFRMDIILPAYERVKRDNIKITDDVAAAVVCGHAVAIVENIFPNPKITVPEDVTMVEFMLSKKAL